MQRSRSSEDLRTILHCSLQAPPSAHKRRSSETSKWALTKVMDCCNMAYLRVTFIHRCTLSNLCKNTDVPPVGCDCHRDYKTWRSLSQSQTLRYQWTSSGMYDSHTHTEYYDLGDATVPFNMDYKCRTELHVFNIQTIIGCIRCNCGSSDIPFTNREKMTQCKINIRLFIYLSQFFVLPPVACAIAAISLHLLLKGGPSPS